MKTVFVFPSRSFVFALVFINSCFAQERIELEPHKLATKHLPNAIQIHNKVISGGRPDGEQAFLELKKLGVKTIISVDGAKPDVTLAKKHGLQYVHLPHGYKGIPQKRIEELAKAVRDFNGPIYIHCHHGKHRSPAAATAACVSAGLIDSTQSLAILKLAGTSENYLGLFQSVVASQKLPLETLDSVRADFPESAKLPAMAESMVDLGHTHERLTRLAGLGWLSLPNQPDTNAAHEALLLVEHFVEMLRLDDVRTQPEGFQKLLRDSESDAHRLTEALRQTEKSTMSGPVLLNIVETFNRISQNCVTCHRQYRDLPN
ncbi:MAG TPA: hypothetical protein VM260_03530 [Pirellula sp.]|nr:hypothetical protein [Pirellula sp.]